jgi:hypothetical protein
MSVKSIVRALPIPEDLNSFWYVQNSSPSVVVVFVHGIMSDSRSCWTESSGVFWPDLVATDKRLGRLAIFMGGYTTFAASGDLRIADAARELLDAMRQTDSDLRVGPLAHSEIVFVCHSTGGIIVRYMLERNQDLFHDKRIGLALIASPSLGANVAHTLDALLRFYNQQLGIQLQPGNADLVDIDNRFRDLIHQKRLDLMGVEAFEHYFVLRDAWLPAWLRQWLPNLGHRVVPREAANVYFGAGKLIPRTDHFSVVKPRTANHPVHSMLVQFLTEFTSARSRFVRGGTGAIGASLPLPAEKTSELWDSLGRLRIAAEAGSSGPFRVNRSHRSIVVQRPDASSTDEEGLVNLSDTAQGEFNYTLVTDAPVEFKDLDLIAEITIGDKAFRPAVTAKSTDKGRMFLVRLELIGNVVEPGGRMVLRSTARFPASVALNEDYWVFSTDAMLTGAEMSFEVRFPKQPASVACYRIAADDKREQIAIPQPRREVDAGGKEVVVYKVSPKNPNGYSYVMTWRLDAQ